MDEFLSSFLVPIVIIFVFAIRIIGKFRSSAEDSGDTVFPQDFDEVPEETPVVPVCGQQREKPFAANGRRETKRPVQAERFSVPKSEKVEPVPDEPAEFAINNEEEARKAMVWSEILRRKYF